ncbi:MAG TPA: catalase, partial [Nevskia sp.]|nr:catalase [Nevskia sp.]
KVQAYLAAHPETRAFMQWLKDNPLPSSFTNADYYSVNAFLFTNAAGRERAVRWSLVPEARFESLDKAHLSALPRDFLFDDLVTRLDNGPARWSLRLTPAQDGDPVNDATKQWPQDRPYVEAGTLVVQRAVTEDQGPCRDITFDPLILPSGIAASNDPLLSARSAAYSVSLARRSGEPAQPSALARVTAEPRP